MHSSLAVAIEGVPLGLAAVKFWTRKKFKGTAALKKKINPTRIPIEKKESVRWSETLKQFTQPLDHPGRCIHIGDRESDIYELFCAAHEIGTHFLIRTCVDRLAGDGDHTIADEMDEVAVKGLPRIEVRDSNGDPDQAVLELRYRKIRALPPIGKQKRYPALTLTVIHAEERGTPKNRKKIDWKLITDLPVGSRTDAIEVLEWYGLRRKIALLHPELAGFLDDDAQPFRPRRAPTLALTATEIGVLDRPVNDKPKARRKTLSHYLIKIARLGGYLARASDPPPGNTVMWRGLSRALSATVGGEFVGN
ncbi:hypothetical protein [Bradyrhizobium sp. LMG 9283]|uniref:hypothetical protein n=1 Tax=Bradyrhizobium sp. LMG 9283 TaxID=592064 RepID=UPI00388F6CF6